MSLRWQVPFWIAAAVVFVIVLWLLREILLPFVAGMALAYLLDPLVKRLERARLNRIVATLLVIGLFVIAFLLLIILIVPILGAQLTAFIERLPNTIARLQALVADPSRSWLRKVVGEGFRDADIGELVRQGSGYLATFLRSLWSGGQALISIFSLVVITPVVAFYVRTTGIACWRRSTTVCHCRIARPCERSPARSTMRLPASCAGRAGCASSSARSMRSACR